MRVAMEELQLQDLQNIEAVGSRKQRSEGNNAKSPKRGTDLQWM